MTPYEWLAGRPYEGQLAEFGASLMVLSSRAGTKANRKGDPIWLRGVFLGKTDNNLFITWHMGGIKASRSAKRCTEHLDIKGISRKNLPGPVAEVPPVMDGAPSQDQAGEDAPPPGPVVTQGGDSATRQGPTRTTYLEGKARQEQAQHKQKAAEESEQEYLDTN